MTLPAFPTGPATRENVMDALIAFLRADDTVAELFPTIQRRFLMIEQMVQLINNGTPLRQPALMLYDGVGLGGGMDEHVQSGFGTPTIVTLKRTIVIYAMIPGGGTPQGPDMVTPGGTVFHPLIEAVTNALGQNNDPTRGELTLGGLVSHCWVEGTSLLMTGEIDQTMGQGMVTLPVNITMYPSL